MSQGNSVKEIHDQAEKDLEKYFPSQKFNVCVESDPSRKFMYKAKKSNLIPGTPYLFLARLGKASNNGREIVVVCLSSFFEEGEWYR